MTKKKYREMIIRQMQELGIYQEQYSLLIDTLADICEKRDANMRQWRKEGKMQMVVSFTNKANQTNNMKSPYFLNDLQYNEQILKYCRELGISPLGIKKLGNPIKSGQDDFEEFMASM